MLMAMVSKWGVSAGTALAIWTLIEAGFGAMFILSVITVGIGAAALWWAIRRMSTWIMGDAIMW